MTEIQNKKHKMVLPVEEKNDKQMIQDLEKRLSKLELQVRDLQMRAGKSLTR